jgi:hypothetical protein
VDFKTSIIVSLKLYQTHILFLLQVISNSFTGAINTLGYRGGCSSAYITSSQFACRQRYFFHTLNSTHSSQSKVETEGNKINNFCICILLVGLTLKQEGQH